MVENTLSEHRITRREFAGLALAGLGAYRAVLHSHRRQAVRRRVGLNVHRVDAPALALLKRLGVTQVRFTLYWRQFLDPHGSPSAAQFRADMRTLRAAGLDVLVVV